MSFSGPFAIAAALTLGLSTGAQAAGAATKPSMPAGPPAVATHDDVASRIDALASSADALPRDRRASLVRRLSALGPAATDALLTRAAADSPAMAALRSRDASAARAFDAAILETLGQRRDPRALPLFKRVFESSADSRVSQAAADGLGRLCEAGGFATLASAARTSGRHASNAWTALGLCRTEASATLLAGRLDSASDSDDVRTLADALGSLGSTWAWQAMGEATRPEGARVRQVASAALHSALARVEGSTATTVREALRMVGE